MSNNQAVPGKAWTVHPNLHEDVSSILKTDGLSFKYHRSDNDRNSIEQYDTNVMGHFICRNKSCRSSGWGSKMVAISIRLYAGRQYNARVYRQRCKLCDRLGHLVLDDESYVERVAYRLRKWSGIAVQAPYYSGESRGPHQSSLCEGCRMGHCSAR